MQDRVDARIAQEGLHSIAVGVAADDGRGLVRNRIGVPRREVVQDDDAVSGGDQSIRTRRADIPGAACYQNRAWLERHTESLRDGITPFAYNDPLAPC